jgi:hypothetical protein
MITSGERLVVMKLFSLGTRIAAIAVVSLAGSAGVASIAPKSLEGHKFSLHARVIMVDGSVRTVTLEGVGCAETMCSRVRAGTVKADSIWLDGLASMRAISDGADGSVKAVFEFRGGAERQASIVARNRVLYIAGWFGNSGRLDLGSVRRIDFDQVSGE